ncbi:MAG TPA: DUF6766 family protein [Kineosporiaceae bacterium]|jgi:hypothetical protein|nr:DUF6766 family protein [Kineosporiaceae bacterium]
MRRFLRENGLTLVFGGLFLLVLAGQAVAGVADYNAQQAVRQLPSIGFWQYLTTAAFAADVTENWQSEYLQFFLYIVATVWLVQRGAPDSKKVGEEGPLDDEREQLGSFASGKAPRLANDDTWRGWVFSRSLGLLMGGIFVFSWAAQSIAGQANHNVDRLRDLQEPLTWGQYVVSSDFWSRTLQNWQSELLAVGSMTIFSVFLRQKGSSESKPVGAPHEATSVEN